MSGRNDKTLIEIHEMLKMLVDNQRQILESVSEIKVEQKKLIEEIKFSNFVLNNISSRNEILN